MVKTVIPRRNEPLLSTLMHQLDVSIGVLVNKLLHDVTRIISRIIIDDEHLRSSHGLTSGASQAVGNMFCLVPCRDDDRYGKHKSYFIGEYDTTFTFARF